MWSPLTGPVSYNFVGSNAMSQISKFREIEYCWVVKEEILVFLREASVRYLCVGAMCFNSFPRALE